MINSLRKEVSAYKTLDTGDLLIVALSHPLTKIARIFETETGQDPIFSL